MFTKHGPAARTVDYYFSHRASEILDANRECSPHQKRRKRLALCCSRHSPGQPKVQVKCLSSLLSRECIAAAWAITLWITIRRCRAVIRRSGRQNRPGDRRCLFRCRVVDAKIILGLGGLRSRLFDILIFPSGLVTEKGQRRRLEYLD
jgi:hypothetical protein